MENSLTAIFTKRNFEVETQYHRFDFSKVLMYTKYQLNIIKCLVNKLADFGGY